MTVDQLFQIAKDQNLYWAEKAIKNRAEHLAKYTDGIFHKIDSRLEYMSQAINCGFDWVETPEGNQYWANVRRELWQHEHFFEKHHS